jgi:hypothetical protein
MDFLNRLKKEMTEGIVRAILDDAGYRTVVTGIEEGLREFRCLSAPEYARLSIPGGLRRLPDLIVMNREQTEFFLVEVKYCSDWNKSVFQDLQDRGAERYRESIAAHANRRPLATGALRSFQKGLTWCTRSQMLELSNGAPMTEGVDNLILEHLKRFQTGQERIERKLDEIVTRLGHMEIGLAGLRREFAHAEQSAAAMGVRMDHINERIERIEKRLELA